MKRYINTFTTLLLGLLVAGGISCDNLLEENPKSMVVENFYKTVDEVETAVNAAYAPLKRGDCFAVFEATLECSSDFAYGRGSWAQISEYGTFNDANINRVAALWPLFYLAIRNANLVIERSPTTNSEFLRCIGEARFIRAFTYFQLVRCWGGVPLRTEKNATLMELPRSTPDEVYSLIISDLVEAEKQLPDVPSQNGRATKWGAKTLLADVYLERGKNKEARDKAYEVIQSNHFSLVNVRSKEDFQNNVWGPRLLKTSEEIFYLKYMHNSGQENYMLWIINHANTGVYNFGGAYAVFANNKNPIYQSWEDGDLRKSLYEQVDFGLGTNTLVSTKFCDKEAISKQGGSNDDPVYGYSDVLLLFAEADARANGTVSTEAIEAVNQIRRRAFGLSPTEPSGIDYLVSDYNKDTFIDLVMKERGYEFQMEGKRWLELKRTGKAKQIIKQVKGIYVSDTHILWPIPISEMNYNLALDPSKDQNPGY